MSVVVSTDVFCDGCGHWEHGVTHPSKARARAARAVVAAMREDYRSRPIRQFRRDGRMVDLCSDCSTDQPTQEGPTDE